MGWGGVGWGGVGWGWGGGGVGWGGGGVGWGGLVQAKKKACCPAPRAALQGSHKETSQDFGGPNAHFGTQQIQLPKPNEGKERKAAISHANARAWENEHIAGANTVFMVNTENPSAKRKETLNMFQEARSTTHFLAIPCHLHGVPLRNVNSRKSQSATRSKPLAPPQG